MPYKFSLRKARWGTKSSRRRPQEGSDVDRRRRPALPRPRLSPEELSSGSGGGRRLHEGPQEDSDIRSCRAIIFRSEQPNLRTPTLPNGDEGDPQRRRPANHWDKHLPRGDDATPRRTTNLTAGRSRRPPQRATDNNRQITTRRGRSRGEGPPPRSPSPDSSREPPSTPPHLGGSGAPPAAALLEPPGRRAEPPADDPEQARQARRSPSGPADAPPSPTAPRRTTSGPDLDPATDHRPPAAPPAPGRRPIAPAAHTPRPASSSSPGDAGGERMPRRHLPRGRARLCRAPPAAAG
nr:uncharacterized protein LOC127310244 [Lolium perenne]